MVCRGRRPVELAGLLSVNAEMVDRRQSVEKREGDDDSESSGDRDWSLRERER